MSHLTRKLQNPPSPQQSASISPLTRFALPLHLQLQPGDRSFLNVNFDQELWIPVNLPTVTRKLTYRIYDFDR